MLDSCPISYVLSKKTHQVIDFVYLYNLSCHIAQKLCVKGGNVCPGNSALFQSGLLLLILEFKQFCCKMCRRAILFMSAITCVAAMEPVQIEFCRMEYE